KLGYLKDIAIAGGNAGWDPLTHSFANTAKAIYYAYVRQIGAGAVATGGFITLIKSLPTIISSFKDSVASLRQGAAKGAVKRTENDLPITVVAGGSAVLILAMAALPMIPGTSIP